MLKYYDFSGVSFLVEKSFECENASENAAARFVQPGTLWLSNANRKFKYYYVRVSIP